MRTLFFILFIFFALRSVAQPLNNEWVNYNNTYYKFKVGQTGLCRIYPTALSGINLQNTPVEQFQLWRNGKQVPLYTTIPKDTMGTSDYIEFWAEQNDGLPDKYLYKDTSYQLSNQLSLQTDTAAFFLTVNVPTAANPNLRFAVAPNALPETLPSPEPYFIYKQRYNFQEMINRGYAQNAGEYVYSSSYDMGEFWSTAEVQLGSPKAVPIGSLFAATTGPTAILKAGFAANSESTRNIRLGFDNNSSDTVGGQISGLSVAVFTNNNIPLSTLNASPKNFNINIVTQNTFDRIVCSYIELQYPRLFNFGGQPTFKFSLPATNQGYYLKISNFKSGNNTPVLYDITNNLRYLANTSIAGILQFALPVSGAATDFILVSEDGNVNAITYVANFEQRNFINYGLDANQGDYMIISNKILGLSNGGAVDQYRAYRSSQYNAKVYDIDELVDQFGYGIKKYPLSIKNFVRYATAAFKNKPAYIFLIGKGVTYDEYRGIQSTPNADKLNLVPTWGWPASDVMLVSPAMEPESTIGVGRLSAISQSEVNTYLAKVKEYEAQAAGPQTISGKLWMKQLIHVAGADDPSLNSLLMGYLQGYENIIKKPLFSGVVANFNKTTTGPVTAVANAQLNALFASGFSLLTYFGHGSSTLLDYANLNDPLIFNNQGKYPVFLTNGCSIGNFFDYDESRFNNLSSITEKYVFAQQKGAIAFIGNSHFGLTNYLDTYSSAFYTSLDGTGYNAPLCKNMIAGTAALKAGAGNQFDNFFTRTHAEETILAGDPVLKINASGKPDFVVEQQTVVTSPSVISVADSQFVVKAYIYNLGKATTDSFVNVLIQRKYPDGKIVELFNKKIPNIIYEDSVILNVPILASRDKGTNQIIVTIDNNNKVDEISETNNSVTKSFSIFDNGVLPIYPQKFAIVNKPSIQLIASTANPIAPLNTYAMDFDTTELFNSPFKVTKTLTSIGGALSFDPGVTFTDSTVYYWRVAQVPTNGVYAYSSSSFVYLKSATSGGFNQSHLYQHLKSSTQRLYLDSFSRKWTYLPDSNNIIIRQAIYPTSGTEGSDFATVVNGLIGPEGACVGKSLIFNIFDPVTLKPFYNQPNPSPVQAGATGLFMGSAFYCGNTGTEYNFEFPMTDTTGRRAARDFMDWIPQGYIVSARLNYDDGIPFVDTWKSDAAYYGTNTLYSHLKAVGLADVDSFNRPRTFVFIYKKNTPSFVLKSKFSNGLYDAIALNLNIASIDTLGYITSPVFGPVTAWKQLQWRGASADSKPGDAVNVTVLGVDGSGNQTPLLSLGVTDQDVDLSSIDAVKYPNIQLAMRNADSIYQTPYQLRYWRLFGNLVPEGGMAPNVKFSFNDTVNPSYASTDTFQQGQYIKAAIAFKNISDATFRDSITVKMEIIDNSNNTTVIPFGKLKKLAPGDTAVVFTTIDAKKYVGANTFIIEVNPDNNQPEQYHANNFIYKSFVVTNDNKNPVLDVTFDGLHILNNDIVSSKPAIRIKMKDDARYYLLNDTSLVTVQLMYPDKTVKQVKFDGDTLRFTPATPSATENAAIVDFAPYLVNDGTYTLIVTGKDRSGNPSGSQQYRVSFQVTNKPMISNVFNYPNPFTTSTAFVFTLTGSEVPQNIKIQILTVTGKIVREITREELGSLHIGNNITSFKWDGTDMYGAKLGNGVYLYHVVTRLNGIGIDKYDTGTDMYFKSGYGKMYLMR
ncbi:C25 family cysteine peptidase [Parasediminibacterium sp. JCM 36343]|uniref:putative type IX secretion system sortase PorU2 n=1 Tax=Parasediminibacterium sp. JCM 36343 TaxID=3374279 RepID=UPI00397D269C